MKHLPAALIAVAFSLTVAAAPDGTRNAEIAAAIKSRVDGGKAKGMVRSR